MDVKGSPRLDWFYTALKKHPKHTFLPERWLNPIYPTKSNFSAFTGPLFAQAERIRLSSTGSLMRICEFRVMESTRVLLCLLSAAVFFYGLFPLDDINLSFPTVFYSDISLHSNLSPLMDLYAASSLQDDMQHLFKAGNLPLNVKLQYLFQLTYIQLTSLQKIQKNITEIYQTDSVVGF